LVAFVTLNCFAAVLAVPAPELEFMPEAAPEAALPVPGALPEAVALAEF
jgi:hypothetical protein